ncbi:MAG: amidase [Lysobacterales bacterium]|nr:MAG: amidase [Xanthomonadales bacterium]
MELCSQPIHKLAILLVENRVSARDLVESCLESIARQNARLRAFICVFEEEARAAADLADQERRSGHGRGPLHGIPVGIKDLADIRGWPTGFGSRAYASGPATDDAFFVTRLRQAGAIPLGKTQMVEFAFGSWGTNHSLGTPINPMDQHVERVAGGSSSGSAVAVAAGMVPLAIGSDTGGSIRIPAALCGIAGLKTSAGLVSTDGVAPLSHTFDTIGPMTRCVEDAALALEALAGTCPPSGPADLAGLRLAAVDNAQIEPLDDFVRQAHYHMVQLLTRAGCQVERFRFPLELVEIQRRNGAIMAYEAYASLRTLVDDEAVQLDPYVRQRVQAGAVLSRDDYNMLLAQRHRDLQAFSDSFAGFDCLFLPTTPITARQLTEVDESSIPLSRLTRAGNYYDLCGLSLPYMPHDNSLPIGMQLLMRSREDARLLSVGARIESLLGAVTMPT